jgi:opacity protein-like surface antigen
MRFSMIALLAAGSLTAGAAVADQYNPYSYSSPGNTGASGGYGSAWSSPQRQSYQARGKAAGGMPDQAGPYMLLDSGVSLSSAHDVGTAALVEGGVGYRFNSHLRSDVTIGYRTGFAIKGTTTTDATSGETLTSDKQNLDSIAMMANVTYDIAKWNRFTPYVTGGLGFAYNETAATTLYASGNSIGQSNAATNTDIAWQLGLGTSIDIFKNVSAEVGYRYISLGQAKNGRQDYTLGSSGLRSNISGGDKVDLTAHEFQAGVKVAF